MRVHFTNLGCKLNQAELEKLARQFHGAGHRVVSSLEDADLHVINTCTVTHMAARDSRKIARRGYRRNARLRTVLTGCYATEQTAAAAEVEGVDLVISNDQKDHLLARVHEAFPDTVPEPPGDGVDAGLPVPYVPLDFGNTRALVKVEDGCNMRCSFCIIPFTRGRQHSRSVADCVAEVRALAEAGFQEVVVTGVQISSYRHEGDGLVDLVRAMLAETDVPRLRLTSIAPWQFDPRLLELWSGEPRLCRHVHMSLQSGSTATLRRMRRPYTAEAYAAVAEAVRRTIPGVALTTDVIAGFPGETDEEFADSLEFTREMGFAKIHAFPYSVREGTLAATLDAQVEHAVKRQRMAALLEVARESERSFWSRHLGSTETVLWEGQRDGLWQGTTDNYIRVLYRRPNDLVSLGASGGELRDLESRLLPTRLLEIREGGVLGHPQAA